MTTPRGINRRHDKHLFTKEIPTCICYCTCMNCGKKWQEEFKAWAVTSSTTQKKFDYCTDCCPDGNAPKDGPEAA